MIIIKKFIYKYDQINDLRAISIYRLISIASCFMLSASSYAGEEGNQLLGHKLINIAVNAESYDANLISRLIDNIHAVYDEIGIQKNNKIESLIDNESIINDSELYSHQANKLIYSVTPIDMAYAENSILISPSSIKVANSINNIIISDSNINVSHSSGSVLVTSGDVKISADGLTKPEGSVILANGVSRISNAKDSVVYSTAGIEISNPINVKVYNAEYVDTGKRKVKKIVVESIF